MGNTARVPLFMLDKNSIYYMPSMMERFVLLGVACLCTCNAKEIMTFLKRNAPCIPWLPLWLRVKVTSAVRKSNEFIVTIVTWEMFECVCGCWWLCKWKKSGKNIPLNLSNCVLSFAAGTSYNSSKNNCGNMYVRIFCLKVRPSRYILCILHLFNGKCPTSLGSNHAYLHLINLQLWLNDYNLFFRKKEAQNTGHLKKTKVMFEYTNLAYPHVQSSSLRPHKDCVVVSCG